MLERAKDMRNSLTSRYKKKQDIKYYTDVNLETKLWEVIELPTRRVVQACEFEEDAINTILNAYAFFLLPRKLILRLLSKLADSAFENDILLFSPFLESHSTITLVIKTALKKEQAIPIIKVIANPFTGP